MQNRSFRLRFCIQELEKNELAYEEIVSAINVLILTANRVNGIQKNLLDVHVASRDAAFKMHNIMYRTGSLHSIIKAAHINDERKFLRNIDNLKSKSSKAEGYINWLITDGMTINEFKENYDSVILNDFLTELIVMRNFLLDQLDFMFRQMGYVGR